MSSPKPLVLGSAVDHYGLLGLSPDATSRDIQRAYHALALSLHPDKRGGGELPQAALTSELTFQQLQEVYHTLIDEQRRLRYDDEWRGQLSPTRYHLSTARVLPLSADVALSCPYACCSPTAERLSAASAQRSTLWLDVEWSELDYQEEGEGEEEDEESDDDVDRGWYSQPCKCGHLHRVPAAEVDRAVAAAHATPTSHSLSPPALALLCPSCSLGLRIHWKRPHR